MATVTGIKLVGLLEFPGLRLPGTEEGKLSTRLYDNQSKLIPGPSNFTALRLAVGRYGLPSTSKGNPTMCSLSSYGDSPPGEVKL